MEKHRKCHLQFLLLLALLLVCIASIDCSRQPLSDNKLICYSDYNRIITCEWNNTHVSDHTNSECTIDANKKNNEYPKSKYAKRACKLKPLDVSKKTLKKCSMDLNKNNAFQTFEEWSIELKCNNTSLKKIDFMPWCNVKLNASGKPDVNFTTVSWSLQVSKHPVFSYFKSQFQWKQEDQSWSDPSVMTKNVGCERDCTTDLNTDWLIQGVRYEARTRVRVDENVVNSTWSDWSLTTSWVSPVGRSEPTDADGGVLGGIVAGAVAFALLLVVISVKTHTTTWVVKKIRGPPIPNPASSFLRKANFQSWLSPHFDNKSFHSFLKQEEIFDVEVTSTADVVASCGSAALLEKIKKESSSGSSSSSSFSNPSYSHLCSPPPISPPSAGNLQPCSTDTPYGPVGSQDKGEHAELDKEEEQRRDMEIIQLLTKGSKDSGSVTVISDYEKVEKLQAERARLQSLDSGVCSGEEVSQESLEPDSINVTDSHDDESEDKAEEEETVNVSDSGKEAVFKKLFGGSGGVFGKGSIQICSDYKRVPNLQMDNTELPSLDSGVSSGGEEQVSQEESPEDTDKSTPSFLFPPVPSFPLPRPMSSFSQLSLKFSGLGLNPALLPLPSQILESNVLMSTTRSVEPSGDGYRPVSQEQS